MKYLLSFLLLGSVACATPPPVYEVTLSQVTPSDIEARPTNRMSRTPVMSGDTSNIVMTCLMLCGTDHLDPANHFDCMATGPDTVTNHTVFVPPGGGNVCVRAVNLNNATPPIVSNPSPNKKTTWDIPVPPIIEALFRWVVALAS